ncbi:MAG: FlgD immunoglobulin-like domain containing protein [Candidatus Krumholzibacteriales bacterium]
MDSTTKRSLTGLFIVMIIFSAMMTAVLPAPLFARISYLDNGVIRVGIDLERGGAISYLSESGADASVVNIRDLGRYIQQSYYSGPDPFIPEGEYQHPAYQGWGWNPVQAGDVYGYRSWAFDDRNDGDSLYVKCVPKQWALLNVDSECTMETWITLEANRVHVRSRLINARGDSALYSGRHQELPAVYTVGTLHRLFTYTGDESYTGAALTQINNSGPPWTYWKSTECWSALVNDDDWGLGIYNPGTILTVGGFHGTPGGGGPRDDNTGYIAPLHTDILDHDIVYQYEYTLILGDLFDDIRSYVYNHAPEAGPDCVFDRDRQHCAPYNLSDTSPPYSGFWRMTLDSADPRVTLPHSMWQAEDVPIIYITCAHHTVSDQAELFFAGADGVFSSERRLTVTVVPDGEVRSYEVDLASHPLYAGAITRLRFDPVITQAPGDMVDLYAITTDKITSAEPVDRTSSAPSIGPVVPNPFNPAATISFYVPNESPLRMAIYDTAGRKVRTLIGGMKHVGRGEIVWDGRSDTGRPVASGIYYCCLKAGGEVRTRKLVLLR